LNFFYALKNEDWVKNITTGFSRLQSTNSTNPSGHPGAFSLTPNPEASHFSSNSYVANATANIAAPNVSWTEAQTIRFQTDVSSNNNSFGSNAFWGEAWARGRNSNNDWYMTGKMAQNEDEERYWPTNIAGGWTNKVEWLYLENDLTFAANTTEADN
jgi:hypothetical protein